MKKLMMGLSTLMFTLSLNAAETESVLLISKTKNEKNVLHYKVSFEPSKCEFTGGLKALWKMDEDDGSWKPLSESMSFIKEPLSPKVISNTSDEIVFETPSMKDLNEMNILDEGRVAIRISPGTNQICEFQTLALVNSEYVDVKRLHSNITMFGSVKWVEIHGETLDGEKYKKRFKNK
jgi:hypothetical protein